MFKKIFKAHTFTWWQLGWFKITVFLWGAVIGATWSAPFIDHIWIFVAIAAVTSIYVGYVYFRQ